MNLCADVARFSGAVQGVLAEFPDACVIGAEKTCNGGTNDAIENPERRKKRCGVRETQAPRFVAGNKEEDISQGLCSDDEVECKGNCSGYKANEKSNGGAPKRLFLAKSYAQSNKKQREGGS